jgi:hypothetical protein
MKDRIVASFLPGSFSPGFFFFSSQRHFNSNMVKESKTKAKMNAKRALAAEAKLVEAAEGLAIQEDSNRVASGVLASHPDSKDIKIE